MEDESKSTDVLDQEGKTPSADESVKEPTVPLHEHTKLRTRAQTAEIKNAKLEGRLEAIEAAQAKSIPAAISPLDAEIARQRLEGIEDDEMTISPTIYRKDQLWNKQRDNQVADATKTANLKHAQGVSADAMRAKHADYDEVLIAGQVHLTQGEFLDVQNAGFDGQNPNVDYGELAYNKCKAALERANPDKKTETAPNLSESEKAEAAKKAAEEAAKKEIVVPTQEEILAAGREQVDPVAVAASQM